MLICYTELWQANHDQPLKKTKMIRTIQNWRFHTQFLGGVVRICYNSYNPTHIWCLRTAVLAASVRSCMVTTPRKPTITDVTQPWTKNGILPPRLAEAKHQIRHFSPLWLQLMSSQEKSSPMASKDAYRLCIEVFHPVLAIWAVRIHVLPFQRNAEFLQKVVFDVMPGSCFNGIRLPRHGIVDLESKQLRNACVKVNSIRIGWFHSVSLHHISLVDLPFNFIRIKQLWPWLRFQFTAPFRPSVCSAISKGRRLRLFWTSTEL